MPYKLLFRLTKIARVRIDEQLKKRNNDPCIYQQGKAFKTVGEKGMHSSQVNDQGCKIFKCSELPTPHNPNLIKSPVPIGYF
jgi:hypothetical protein